MLRCKNHQDLGRCSAGAVCGSAGVDDSCNPQNFSISLILIVTTIPNLTFLSSDFLHSLKHIFLVITSNTFPLGLPYSVPCSVPYLDQLVLILLCRRTGDTACLKCHTIHRHGYLILWWNVSACSDDSGGGGWAHIAKQICVHCHRRNLTTLAPFLLCNNITLHCHCVLLPALYCMQPLVQFSTQCQVALNWTEQDTKQSGWRVQGSCHKFYLSSKIFKSTTAD